MLTDRAQKRHAEPPGRLSTGILVFDENREQ